MGKIVVGLLVIIGLSACGGGGGSSDFGADLTWRSGVFLDKSIYANYCELPRSGNDPFNNNQPYPDRVGSVITENFFLRSWTNELYLWYDEVLDQDPNLFITPDYFDALRTTELSPSGLPKDNFHFSEDTFNYLNRTEGGITFGYGMNLVFVSTSPPRELIVRDIVPGSPAAAAGLLRGMTMTSVDGEDLIFGSDVDTLNNGLFPTTVGEDHTFTFTPFGSNEEISVTMASSSISTVPVKATTVINTPTGNVGYLHFSSHIRPSEQGLFDAFTELANASVDDVVIDLRYNGGGLLAIAGQVGYMAAGAQSNNEVFYRLNFNDQHPTIDPVTGQALTPSPFYNTTLGFAEGLSSGLSLPTLSLNRVFILSTGSTCSASEAIINGLLGIDVEVILIGDTTCGKPYGFYPQDNCGTTYFSVQFAGVNAKGFGEYPDGFSPANKTNPAGVVTPGCWVFDDFSRQLGDPEEALFAAALQYRENGTCPTLPVVAKPSTLAREKPSDPAQAISVPETHQGLINMILE